MAQMIHQDFCVFIYVEFSAGVGLFHIAVSLRVLAASTFRTDASEFKAGNTLSVIFGCCTYYCLVFVGHVT